jgi:hypothetical protein
MDKFVGKCPVCNKKIYEENLLSENDSFRTYICDGCFYDPAEFEIQMYS